MVCRLLKLPCWCMPCSRHAAIHPHVQHCRKEICSQVGELKPPHTPASCSQHHMRDQTPPDTTRPCQRTPLVWKLQRAHRGQLGRGGGHSDRLGHKGRCAWGWGLAGSRGGGCWGTPWGCWGSLCGTLGLPAGPLLLLLLLCLRDDQIVSPRAAGVVGRHASRVACTPGGCAEGVPAVWLTCSWCCDRACGRL